MKPNHATMYWWRRRGSSMSWTFGYCTHLDNQSLVRMGNWNGDTTGGNVVSWSEIEVQPYD